MKLDLSVPKDLVIDDEPLEGILYGKVCRSATPADILELAGREELTSEGMATLAAVIAEEPDLGFALSGDQLARVLEHCAASLVKEGGKGRFMLARLLHAAGRAEAAEAAYRELLGSDNPRHLLPPVVRWRARDALAQLCRQSGRGAEAKVERAMAEAERLLASDLPDTELVVRGSALDLYQAGHYQASECLYRALVERGFQVPGTYVHLARVLLMQDRVQEAREAVACASKALRSRSLRSEVQPYVPLRVLFLRILCAMLAREDHTPLLKKVSRELNKPDSRLVWTIEPVIRHLVPSLRPRDVPFLEAMAEALNSEDNSDRLKAHLA